MADRQFPPRTIRGEPGTTWKRVHRIQCSECPITHEVTANTSTGARAIEDLMNIWRRGGWTIGRNAGHDLCPNCTSARLRRRRRPSANEAEIPTAQVIPMPKVQPEPPRTPTFDEKRIILSKLHDVYVDETTGYDRGWSDKRVAEDLGVPRAWVAELRDQNFGPVRDNEDAREALAQFEALASEVRNLLSDVREKLAAAKAAREAIEAASAQFSTEAAALAERLRVLEKSIEEVKRAVA